MIHRCVGAAIIAAGLTSPVLARADVFDVRQFGARGDQTTLDTPAFQAAVDQCSAAGGGTVYTGPGNYLCGTIQLRTGVRLLLDAGATIWASRRAEDYGKLRCLLVADHAERISVVGPGTLRGIGDDNLRHMSGKASAPMPEFRAGTIRFEHCQDVVVRDLTILLSDTWTVNLRHCENVLIHGLTIRNNYFHTNSDGIDPVSCRNVRISDCHIVAGDDCIVLKTHDDQPCENVVVTNCTLESIATALKLGTESPGDFRNVYFTNCTIRNSVVGLGLFLKDGGSMERITFDNIYIETPQPDDPHELGHSVFPIFVDIERRHPDSKVGRIRDLTFSNIQMVSGAGVLVQGMPECAIENLTLRNITLRVRRAQDYAERRKHVGGRRTTRDERDTLYARAAAYVTLAYVDRVVVDQLQVFVTDDDMRQFPRAALEGHFLRDASIAGVFRRPATVEGGPAPIVLRDCTAAD